MNIQCCIFKETRLNGTQGKVRVNNQEQCCSDLLTGDQHTKELSKSTSVNNVNHFFNMQIKETSSSGQNLKFSFIFYYIQLCNDFTSNVYSITMNSGDNPNDLFGDMSAYILLLKFTSLSNDWAIQLLNI